MKLIGYEYHDIQVLFTDIVFSFVFFIKNGKVSLLVEQFSY